MELYKNVSACVVLINPEGLILAVSRKDDLTSMGLPGGKMDPEDNNDPMITAIRECKEETGLDVSDLKLVFAIHKSGNMGYTYLAKYSGEINHNEPHVVKWVPFQVLINGCFGRYNQMVSESLDSMGIKYQKNIDIQIIKEKLIEFVSKNKLCSNNVTVRRLIQEHDIVSGKSKMILYLNEISEEDLDEFDTNFIDGIRAIGDEFGIRISLPNYYYSK